MTDFRGGDAAVEEYRSALLGAARDRAVADAEREVCLAWAAELAHVGHMTRLGVATAKAACDAARTLVRAHQAAGDPQALSEAQKRLEMAEEQARQSVGAADALLEIIGEEQELMSRADQERALVAQANRVRVWSAWEAVRDIAGVDSPSPELDGLNPVDAVPGVPDPAAQNQSQPASPGANPAPRPESGGRKRFWRGASKRVPGTGRGTRKKTGSEPGPSGPRIWRIGGSGV